MLCNFCSQISFQPLSECRFSFRPDADPQVVQGYSKKLFYFHHCCIACINKASLEEGCRLCSFFLTCFKGRINISRDDKLGAALNLPGAGVWVVLTQYDGRPATTTDGRTFAVITEATNYTGSFTLHYDKFAATIDLRAMPAGFDEILVDCPSSVPKDMPMEDDKAWLGNSMRIAKAWYKDCQDSGYHGACASASTKTVRLPARVIDVGPEQSPSAVFRRPYALLGEDRTITHSASTHPVFGHLYNFRQSGKARRSPDSIVGHPLTVSSAYPKPQTSLQGPESIEQLVTRNVNPGQGWGIEKLSIEDIVRGPKSFPNILETDGRSGRYLTLSYCWGSTQKGELMTANLEAYKRSLPVDKLSRTIRDAIAVTHALGFRYLWVDALCIIQDSDVDKKSQLPLMGSIYQDSEITIAAAVGDHADAGLFATRNPHACRPCPLYKISLPNGSTSQIYAQLPRDELGDTPLDTRAWIFQEEILARRTLKFSSKGLRWSCASFCMAEATPSIGLHPRSRPHHNLREWLSQPDWKPNWAEALDPRRRYFEDWYEAVANFTQRDIKFSSDRLPAMAGLAAKVGELKGYHYLQGLWKEDLEFGLLWFVSKSGTRGDYISQILRGSEYYRVVPASGSSSTTHLSARGKARAQKWPDTSADFIRDIIFPESKNPRNYPRDLLVVRVALGDEVLLNLPSWTWARLNNPIEFLYTIRSLNATGKPMAQCLEVPLPKKNTYLGDPSGYVVLKGAMQTVVVRPCERLNAAPSVSNGRWTAQLLRVSWELGQLTGTIVGYAALDEDPQESNIAGKSMRILLMRDDSIDPCMESSVTPSGFLRPACVVPLSFAVDERGFITGTSADEAKKREEWVTCLLLEETKKWAQDVYRRVGLCQMYSGVWEGEVKDILRRQETVVLI